MVAITFALIYRCCILSLYHLYQMQRAEATEERLLAKKDIRVFTLDNAPARAAREFKSCHDMQSTSAEQRGNVRPVSHGLKHGQVNLDGGYPHALHVSIKCVPDFSSPPKT
ncbi:hypothetical protein C2857_004055 [Epichloe festucae Fl1]|uniref:Uncharacterized protein n=1 Tax=Epichloe festucae (strain Fl1) TaxID=877507 RepID=A0A7S9KNZ5_EPIFF|nr:hypothetical protein C2857_004055 [Epichloe festucae Fl1]